MEEIPLLYRGALRSLFASLEPYVSKDKNTECEIMKLGSDETNLDGLADPTRPTDTEYPCLEVPCCLAFALPHPPVLGLWQHRSRKVGL